MLSTQNTSYEVPVATLKPVPYKYRLQELWVNRFGNMGTIMRQEFIKSTQISATTFKRDFNALRNAPYRIPDERLQKYAEFLNAEVSALRNYLTIEI